MLEKDIALKKYKSLVKYWILIVFLFLKGSLSFRIKQSERINFEHPLFIFQNEIVSNFH